MKEPQTKLKFTVVESPVNQVIHQKILQNFTSYSSKGPQQYSIDISSIRKSLQNNSKIAESISSVSQKDMKKDNDPINSISNAQPREVKQRFVLSTAYLTTKGLEATKPLSNQKGKIDENNKVNIYKQLHFPQQGSKHPPKAFVSAKNEKLNHFLQQIGQFKKSINQIREKLQHNIQNSRQLSKNFSDKKGQKRSKYQYRRQYNHENYEYTNYKDLSNRGKANCSYDRWNSHEKGYTFLKDHAPIKQFVIDVSDIQTPAATK